ncbi:hypothetical protein GCM10010129_71110 [Streptomyces fumigatiscleroticus]|nr:hypothetical protein GCM10010129_71110 [Streptomyces fumigatiscleroticus]
MHPARTGPTWCRASLSSFAHAAEPEGGTPPCPVTTAEPSPRSRWRVLRTRPTGRPRPPGGGRAHLTSAPERPMPAPTPSLLTPVVRTYSSAAAYAAVADDFPGDTGLLAALLLGHVHLDAGEALYPGAGVPHAYLRGTGVEITANSDNVLRRGLTDKRVDTALPAGIVDLTPLHRPSYDPRPPASRAKRGTVPPPPSSRSRAWRRAPKPCV